MLPARRLPATGLCLLMLAVALLGMSALAAPAGAHRTSLNTPALKHTSVPARVPRRTGTAKPTAAKRACARRRKSSRKCAAVKQRKKNARTPSSSNGSTPASGAAAAEAASDPEEAAEPASAAPETSPSSEPTVPVEEAVAANVPSAEVPLEEGPSPEWAQAPPAAHA